MGKRSFKDLKSAGSMNVSPSEVPDKPAVTASSESPPSESSSADNLLTAARAASESMGVHSREASEELRAIQNLIAIKTSSRSRLYFTSVPQPIRLAFERRAEELGFGLKEYLYYLMRLDSGCPMDIPPYEDIHG